MSTLTHHAHVSSTAIGSWECYCDDCRWRVIVQSFDQVLTFCDVHEGTVGA